MPAASDTKSLVYSVNALFEPGRIDVAPAKASATPSISTAMLLPPWAQLRASAVNAIDSLFWVGMKSCDMVPVCRSKATWPVAPVTLKPEPFVATPMLPYAPPE